MAEVIQFGKFITASEREVASRLKDLPANWTVICNKEVVTPAGDTYEVDFVIIGEHVIFAIDEKSWSGDIYGNENVWVLPGGEPRRSPLQKIGHVGRQLAGVLRGRIREPIRLKSPSFSWTVLANVDPFLMSWPEDVSSEISN